MVSRSLRTAVLLALVSACGDKAEEADDGSLEDTAASTGDDGDGCEEIPWYPDIDSDGFGDVDSEVWACARPDGFIKNGGDCDDADASVHPAAAEVCNGIDDNCDGDTDEGVSTTLFQDSDGDGYGSVEVQGCEETSELVAEGGDCDETDAEVNPGATEECNEVDDDCDGDVDEDAGETWYTDGDYDGYGDPDSGVRDCEEPSGAVANGDDCDDSSAASYPGAEDTCDGEDNDCDGDVDEDHKAGWQLVTLGDDGIYEVDTTNAGLSLRVELGGDYEGYNPTSSDVAEDGTAIYHSNGDFTVSEFDVCDGTVSDIGPTGWGKSGAIAFGPGGNLYLVEQEADLLMTVDTTSGAATSVGSLGIDIGNNGIAYDCATDRLLVIDATTDALYEADRTTGTLTKLVGLSPDYSSVGMEYDAATGLLWTSTGSQLHEVDPSSGSATLVGTFSQSPNDLALVPTCP